MRNYAEQVRKYIPGRYEVLGTDGFGRSDSRAALRDFSDLSASKYSSCVMPTLLMSLIIAQ
jgi:pyruvate dehydrogenase E1 component